MTPISRAAWDAKAPSGSYTHVGSTRGVKVHYTGGPVPAGIVDDHNVCVRHVRDIQRMHMAGSREVPYMDIAYNLVACPHRKVFMGRGPHHLPAANGPGLNTAHYAVLALVGDKGFTQPTDDLLHAVRDAIEYLREHGDAGNEIKGHRDGYATDCPGGPLYAWVRKGAPRPPSKPEAPIKIVLKDGVPQWPGRLLKVATPLMHGADIRLWQQKMHDRGWSIDVDGIYGPQSASVAKGFRKATGLKAVPEVDKEAWDMTWSWRPPEPPQPGLVNELT